MKHIRRGERDFKISKATGLGMITMLSGSLRQRFALDRKLSCCWQDRAAAVSDPGVAVGGCARRWLDCYSCVAASNRDCGPAPFPAAILTDLTVFRIGGNLLVATIEAAPLAFRTTANGLTALKLRGLEDLLTIATTPFDHAGVVSPNWIGERILETFVELVPHPRMALSFTRS